MYWKDHTFIICAYGESPYLEACIRSLRAQEVPSAVCIATSTPNGHIQGLAQKYGLRLYVNIEQGGIGADWNFAYASARTPYRTIAHQDDLYFPGYTRAVRRAAGQVKKPLIFFTDYQELRGKRYVRGNALLRIKRLMLYPLRRKSFQENKWIRRRILSLGSPICCPSVSFACADLPEKVFVPGLRASLDWEAWERLSRLPGAFVYIPEPLMAHRIHGESETSAAILGHVRSREDLAMYERFWPPRIARILERMYAASERSNG